MPTITRLCHDLGIKNPWVQTTCIGYGQRKPTCGNPVAERYRSAAVSELETIRDSLADGFSPTELTSDLKFAAGLLLCRKNHQSQAEEKAQEWVDRLNDSANPRHSGQRQLTDPTTQGQSSRRLRGTRVSTSNVRSLASCRDEDLLAELVCRMQRHGQLVSSLHTILDRESYDPGSEDNYSEDEESTPTPRVGRQPSRRAHSRTRSGTPFPASDPSTRSSNSSRQSHSAARSSSTSTSSRTSNTYSSRSSGSGGTTTDRPLALIRSRTLSPTRQPLRRSSNSSRQSHSAARSSSPSTSNRTSNTSSSRSNGSGGTTDRTLARVRSSTPSPEPQPQPSRRFPSNSSRPASPASRTTSHPPSSPASDAPSSRSSRTGSTNNSTSSGNECGICLRRMRAQHELSSCTTCHQSTHAACFDLWIAHSPEAGVRCIYCRDPVETSL